ncbi:MAG: hypothetical protein Q8M83_03210 [bacterium]|nr:hypothetical protein [bacterium]
MQDISNYEKIREDTCVFYKNIGSIRCPALAHQLVHFTSEGFNHLIYKGNRSGRDKSVQIMKFKLLSRAKEIIMLTTTYQEYDESLTKVRKKHFKKIVYESAVVKYWGFVAIIRNFRVKVIVRAIGNGQNHFWSVIPAWSTSHYRDIKLISNAKGNLAED